MLCAAAALLSVLCRWSTRERGAEAITVVLDGGRIEDVQSAKLNLRIDECKLLISM